jgi:hypothetical protein
MQKEKVSKVLSLNWRVLISVFAVMVAFTSNGQIDAVINAAKPQVVHDPTAAANAGATISGITNMVSGINRQIEFLQDAANRLGQVSSFIQTLQLLEEIKFVKEQFYIESQTCMDMARKAEVALGIRYAQMQLLALYGTTRRLESNLQITEGLLTNNLVQMSTAERMDFLRKIKSDLLEGLVDVRLMRRNIQYAIARDYYNRMYIAGSLDRLSR